MIKKYYVYAWFNEETEYVFYVGMGKGSRFAIKDYNSRSKLFIDYYNNHKCDVMFLEVQLTKEEAELKETEYIKYYKSLGQCCCNITLNGKSGSGYGVNNPNYNNHKLKETYKNKPALKELTKHCGEDNGRAIMIALCNHNGEIIKTYNCIKYAAIDLINNGITDASILTVSTAISKSARTGKPYKEIYFKFL